MKKIIELYGIGIVFFGILANIGYQAVIDDEKLEVSTFTRLKAVALESFLWPIGLFNIASGNVNFDNCKDSAKAVINMVK